MAEEATAIDISSMPEVARLAQEVAKAGRPHVLRQDDRDVAILSPARPRRARSKGKAVTQADVDAALSVAGAWKDWMNPDDFKRARRELQVHDRLPREL